MCPKNLYVLALFVSLGVTACGFDRVSEDPLDWKLSEERVSEKEPTHEMMQEPKNNPPKNQDPLEDDPLIVEPAEPEPHIPAARKFHDFCQQKEYRLNGVFEPDDTAEQITDQTFDAQGRKVYTKRYYTPEGEPQDAILEGWLEYNDQGLLARVKTSYFHEEDKYKLGFGYDGKNRLISCQNEIKGAPVMRIQYEYDELDRIISTESDGTTSLNLYSEGKVQRILQNERSETRTEVDYFFNERGQLIKSERYRTSSQVRTTELTRTYHEDGSMKTRGNRGYVEHFTYTDGQLTGVTTRKGAEQELHRARHWSFDDQGRLATLTETKSNGVVLSYQYFYEGNTVEKHLLDKEGGTSRFAVERHVYDEGGNLLEFWQNTHQNDSWNKLVTYDYDCLKDLPSPATTINASSAPWYDAHGERGPVASCNGPAFMIQPLTHKAHDYDLRAFIKDVFP